MEEHAAYPCLLKSPDGSCAVLIHVDDLLVVGKRDFVLNGLLAKLREKYEISAQVIERPGDELSFLKRTHVLHADGRMTIQTHQKHVTQICSLLKMNGRIQSKQSPGHADMDKEDTTKELDAAASTFRTCVGILMYLAK